MHIDRGSLVSTCEGKQPPFLAALDVEISYMHDHIASYIQVHRS